MNFQTSPDASSWLPPQFGNSVTFVGCQLLGVTHLSTYIVVANTHLCITEKDTRPNNLTPVIKATPFMAGIHTYWIASSGSYTLNSL